MISRLTILWKKSNKIKKLNNRQKLKKVKTCSNNRWCSDALKMWYFIVIKARIYKKFNISRGLQCLNICFPDSICWSIFKTLLFHVNVKETEVQNVKLELGVLKWKKFHRNCCKTLLHIVHIMQPFLCKMSQKKTSRSLPFIYSFLNKNISIHYRRFVQSWGLATYTCETTLVLVQNVYFLRQFYKWLILCEKACWVRLKEIVRERQVKSLTVKKVEEKDTKNTGKPRRF